MNRRLLLGIAAGGVLALTAGGFVALRAGDKRPTYDLSKEPFETASPSPVRSLAPLLPTFGVPTAPSVPPVVATTPPPAPTRPPSPSATSVVTRTPAPSGPAPTSWRPGPPRALPTGCYAYGHACEYPGTKDEVTSGVHDLECSLTGPDGIHVTWDSDNLVARGDSPPVEQFVVRVWRHPEGSEESNPVMRGEDRLYQVRVSRDTAGVTIRNLQRGQRYACFVQELNAAGLSAARGVVHLRTAPAPTSSPTESPTAEPSATGTP